jgi:CheY-like chemotaxis protein
MNREKRTLLIVDGSASHRFYLGTMLRRLEYRVQSVASADDAMKSMAEEQPSLVIMDYSLPDMNGFKLQTMMKKDKRLKTVPAIMQGPDDGPSMKEQCTAEGFKAYFKKPADIQALYSVIQTELESSPRQTIRIETAFRVEISDGTPPGRAVRQEYATALSDGGLYIRSLTPEPMNTDLALKLFLDDRVITATAVVLYSTREYGGGGGPGMGLKFLTIDDPDRGYIRDYIQKQISKDLSLG